MYNGNAFFNIHLRIMVTIVELRSYVIVSAFHLQDVYSSLPTAEKRYLHNKNCIKNTSAGLLFIAIMPRLV